MASPSKTGLLDLLQSLNIKFSHPTNYSAMDNLKLNHQIFLTSRMTPQIATENIGPEKCRGFNPRFSEDFETREKNSSNFDPSFFENSKEELLTR